MKICCISDTHGKHDRLNLEAYPADMLIHAGDITSGGTFREVLIFLEWFSVQDYKYKVFIPGNHDICIEEKYEDFLTLLGRFSNIAFLHNSGIEIDGINIWGSGDTPEFCNWAFNKTEEELKETWALVPKDIDILVSHGPAYGILDLVNNTWSVDPNVGCKSLRDVVTNSDIKHCIVGHIHEQGGKSIIIDGTTFHNASVLDEKYKMVNAPIIIEYISDIDYQLEEDKAEYEQLKLEGI